MLIATTTHQTPSADQIAAQLLSEVEDSAALVSRQLRKAARQIEEAQELMAAGSLPTYQVTSHDVVGQTATEIAEAAAQLHTHVNLSAAIAGPEATQAAYERGVRRGNR